MQITKCPIQSGKKRNYFLVLTLFGTHHLICIMSPCKIILQWPTQNLRYHFPKKKKIFEYLLMRDDSPQQTYKVKERKAVLFPFMSDKRTKIWPMDIKTYVYVLSGKLQMKCRVCSHFCKKEMPHGSVCVRTCVWGGGDGASWKTQAL